jgi:hypothetical protein
MLPLVERSVAASALAAASLLLAASAQAATTSDPFPALRVGIGGAAAFAPGAGPDAPQGGFALDVNLGLFLHRSLRAGSADPVTDATRALRQAPSTTGSPLAAPQPQVFFAIDAGYSYQGSGLGGHRGLLGMSLGAGQAQQGWAVAYTPRFIAGQAGDAIGIGARNGLSAFFFGTAFGLEVGHQFLLVRGQLQHEVVGMVTLNPLTPLYAYGLFRSGRLSH